MNPTQIQTQPAGGIERSSEITQPRGVAQAAAHESQRFLLCEHCQAPVDRDQRYCVNCGARQSHARNPATTYFATAARTRRTGGLRTPPETARRGPLAVLGLVLLPLAVAIGVLVGKNASSANNAKLIAALQKQQPILAASPSTAASTSEAGSTSPGNLARDFVFARRVAVEVSTLPLKGTDQASVARAEQGARAKGAGKVGLINPTDFKTKPSLGTSSYIIYSGEYKTRAEASRALAKLRAHFPSAQVIEVAP